MSSVRTKASNLNPSFPVAGTNNSSQGFRDNTSWTLQALNEAGDELDKLQRTHLQFTGDLNTTSTTLDSAVASGVSDPVLNISVDLADVMSGPTTLDTRTHDIQLTLDTKGRVIVSSVQDFQTTYGTGTAAGTGLGPSGSALGTGSGTITFPLLTFDAKGRLTGAQATSLTYGLMGQTLAQAAILVGNSSNISTVLAPPSGAGTYALINNGTTISWQAAGGGTVTGVIGGNGIQVTGSGNSPTVKLDLTNTPLDANISDSDLIVWHDVANNLAKHLLYSDFKAKTVKVQLDTTPTLGGNLNTAGHLIQSAALSPKSSIAVLETGTTIQGSTGAPITLSAPSLTLNGLNWPVLPGTPGQYLTLSTGNQINWTSPAQFFQTLDRTFFVSPTGQDTTGNGSLNAPYASIAKALTQVPNSSADLYTIMLIGGTYAEDVSLDQKTNIAFEGFYASHKSVITGKISAINGTQTLFMSKVSIDNTARDSSDQSPVIDVNGNISNIEFRDCDILRGGGPLSDLTAINFFGQASGDILFNNCSIEGRVVNGMLSSNGARLVINNSRLPNGGWTGLTTYTGTSTYVNNLPLISGIRHEGGVLVMENVGAVKPVDVSVTLYLAGLPLWTTGKPVFYDISGNQVFQDSPGVTLALRPTPTLLLDPTGLPVADPLNPGQDVTTPYVQVLIGQPPVTTDYVVGLYSTADASANDSIELSNVKFLYNGEFSKVYKSGSCEWTFSNVKRRADWDFVAGTRTVYDLQPDSGQMVAHYSALGSNLTYSQDSSPVPGGVIDPQSGRTFEILLTGPASLTFKTPLETGYQPSIAPYGEMVTDILVIVKQDSTGDRTVEFSDDASLGITWTTAMTPNNQPNSVTLYNFRYFSRTRRWLASRVLDGTETSVQQSHATSKTLALSDIGSYVRANNPLANTLVIPNNSDVPFPIGTQIQIVQAGVGQTQVVASSNVVVNTPVGVYLRTRYSKALLTKVGGDTWDLEGDLDTTKPQAPMISIDSTLVTIDSTSLTIDG